ncbi:MAG: hypothetical protein JKY95_03470 [Planctomycetaceae bacterium]|nr:hypothetical protein [Planctomycetaceae bacterium]
MFGIKRLLQSINRNRENSIQSKLSHLRDCVISFRGGKPAKDDLTAILIESHSVS